MTSDTYLGTGTCNVKEKYYIHKIGQNSGADKMRFTTCKFYYVGNLWISLYVRISCNAALKRLTTIIDKPAHTRVVLKTLSQVKLTYNMTSYDVVE